MNLTEKNECKSACIKMSAIQQYDELKELYMLVLLEGEAEIIETL